MMWLFLIMIYSSFCNSIAQDPIPEIEITIFQSEGKPKCNDTKSYVIQNSQYRVLINYNKDIYHERCYKEGDYNVTVLNNFQKENITTRSGYVSPAFSGTHLGGSLKCTFYTRTCQKSYNLSTSCYYYSKNMKYEANLVTCKISALDVTSEEMRSIPSGSLSVNGEPITTIMSSVRRSHNTCEGEPIIFLCNTTTGGYVEISYTKQDKTTLSTTVQPTKSVQWYMKMTKAYNNGTSLTCNIFDRNRKLTNSIQLDFIVDEHPETAKGCLSFEVNGLLLPFTQRGKEYTYEYKFYKTEQLTIGIVYDQRMQYNADSCKVYGPNPPYNLTHYFKSHRGIMNSPVSITLEQGGTETSIKCTVTLNDIIKKIYVLHLILLYQGPDYTPFIGGLLRKNILMKYSNGTSNIIHYEYDNNALHNLRCSDEERGDILTGWKYNSELIYKHQIANNEYYFLMNENIKSTVMECKSISSGKTTYLEIIRETPTALATTTTLTPLRVVPSGIPPVLTSSIPPSKVLQDSMNFSKKNQQKQNQKPPNTYNGKRPKYSSTKTTRKLYQPIQAYPHTTPITSQGMSTKPDFVITPTSPRNIPSSSTDPPLGQITTQETTPQQQRIVYMVAAVVVVAVLIFISILWVLIFAFKKRKLRLKQTDDINYQNLPQHNEGPMLMPAQWDSQNDQAVYGNVTNLQDLYSKPIPKNQRSQRKKGVRVEPTYAQVKDANTCEPTYASIYKDEPAYAEAGKNELAYAAIGKNEPAYAQIEKYEPTYAEAGEIDKYQNFEQLTGLANQQAYINIAENNPEHPSRPLSPRNPNYTENMGCEQNYANAQELKRETETEYANLKA